MQAEGYKAQAPAPTKGLGFKAEVVGFRVLGLRRFGLHIATKRLQFTCWTGKKQSLPQSQSSRLRTSRRSPPFSATKYMEFI